MTHPSHTPARAAATTAHLTPDLMARAQRDLLAKAIGELSHERVLAPERLDAGAARWRLTTPDGRTTYDFDARRHALEHWVVEPVSIRRTVDGREAPLDVQAFVAEMAADLGIPPALLPTYLEEIASTLASSAWKLARPRSVADLVDADWQTLEGAMTEGHPAFVANNGRIGFGADDHAAYAPETSSDVALLWVAVRRDQARLSLARGLDEETHYRRELGEETLARFAGVLRDRGLDPAAYLLLPVHPFQWVNRLAITFAPDVGRGDVVLLGEGPGRWRPQQSIRTFCPVGDADRSLVKTALAVQNMGFLRGLSPRYMEATPAVNDWVHDLVTGDATLVGCGFTILREHAAIGWTGDVYHRLAEPSPYRKMVAALWRESPLPALAEGERMATMAALLHRDHEGRSLAAAWIRVSGLDPQEWVRRYLRAYLRPLVHCLVAHEVAFMPHGENVVLVLAEHAPVRAVLKDVGEEVAVLDDQPLPADVERIRADVPTEDRALAIHTDVLDGVLRFLGAILDEDGVLAEAEFWDEVRACVRAHAEDHPELAEAHARHDLLRPRFRHSCLNRLQLRNTLEMVDLADQAESLMFAGTLANPIAEEVPARPDPRVAVG